MIYRVVVCDDVACDLEEMSGLVSHLLEEAGIESCVDRFQTADQLLTARNRGDRWDLILLDIIMDGIDGIQLAQALRRDGDQTDIIFITCSSEFALAGYQAYPVTYLLKPLTREKLEPALSRCLHLRKRPSPLVLPGLGGAKLALSVEEIRYIEVFRRELAVHCKDETLSCAGPLKAVLNELPGESFYRCHRSYVVNLNRVSGMRKYCFLLQDGETVPIAMRTYSQAQARWLNHLKRMD